MNYKLLNTIDYLIIVDIIIILILVLGILRTPITLILIFLDFLISMILFYDIGHEVYNSENKLQSVCGNLVSFITTIPYDIIGLIMADLSSMGILKLLRFLRIILKVIDLLTSNKELKIKKVAQKTHTTVVFNILFTILLISAIIIPFSEDIESYESIYFVIMTFSSVGYGDIVASNAFGKLISTIVAITGIFGIGFLSTFCLTYISFDEKNEKELKDEVNELKKQNEIIINLLKNKKE